MRLRWLGQSELPFDVPMTPEMAMGLLGVAFGILILFILWTYTWK